MVEMEHSVTVSEASSTVSSTGNGSQVGAVMADEPSTSPPHAPPPTKRRRNQPGMPDPEAEVVALSPKTLMAKNRFVCEICGKGFQRDQNLQLHRRGHNLPWKLRQRTAGNEVKKRVYVCPEPGCVHHDPRRALGDLTGIKKHFYRKHGEKKWKCERCSKKYAVQSDWKAHMKTCGTKEYKCDCGTIFSRRDSFVTHRAFCDALTQESAKVDSLTILSPAAAAVTVAMQNDKASPSLSPPHVVVGAEAPAGSTSANFSPPLLSIHSPELQENQIGATHQTAGNGAGLIPASSPSNGNNSVFDTIFAPISGFSQPLSAPQQSSFFNLANSAIAPPPSPPSALSLSPFYQFPANAAYASAPPHPAMSATALLQRAAEMGSSGPGSSLLCGFGLAVSPPPTAPPSSSSPRQHDKAAKTENGSPVADGLGLGLPSDETFGGSSPSMMDELFGSKPTTLDFLGLGVDTRNPYLESMSSPFGVAAAFGGTSSPVKGGAGWDDAAQRYTTGKE